MQVTNFCNVYITIFNHIKTIPGRRYSEIVAKKTKAETFR
jgi:hypothetical protein